MRNVGKGHAVKNPCDDSGAWQLEEVKLGTLAEERRSGKLDLSECRTHLEMWRRAAELELDTSGPQANLVPARLLSKQARSAILEAWRSEPIDFIDTAGLKKEPTNSLISDALAEVRRPSIGDRKLAQECLFRGLNFARSQAEEHRQSLSENPGALDTVREHLAAAEIIRNHIAQSNFGLVHSMVRGAIKAGKLPRAAVDIAQSNASEALMRSVDKFDYGQGFMFSTYACRAIVSSISRTALLYNRHANRFITEDRLPVRADGECCDIVESERTEHREAVFKALEHVWCDLDPVEKKVLSMRFREQSSNGKRYTLEEVGRLLKVTKERVRQIQNKALIKLREQLPEWACEF